MDEFIEAEQWKDTIGITIFVVFIGGIVLAAYGLWLKRHGNTVRGKRLIAIGVFTTLLAMFASILQPSY
jgi:hypothetical protein